MDMIPLSATARSETLKPKALRRSGKVPCVVYGHAVKNLHVQCDELALHKAFVKAGESTLVELDIEGKKVPVLFKAMTFDPISDREMHADFYAVNMNEEIETLVPIHFEGESPAVKELGGVFVVTHENVRVRCLPADLPHNFTVSIAPLEVFHSVLSVKDLTVPKGVTIMDAPEVVIATVQEPRKEEEIAPPPAPAAEGAEGAVTAEGQPAGEGAAAAGAPGAAAPGTTPAAPAKAERGGKEKK